MIVSHRPANARLPSRYCDEEMLPALRLARSSRFARRIAKVLVVLLMLVIVGLLFMPWQQTVAGSGRVVTYAPQQRQQTVHAPITGRIIAWNERVVEGARVAQGEKILEMQDIDPNYLARLEEKQDLKQAEYDAAQSKANSYQTIVGRFEAARDAAIEAARKQVDVAREKLRAEQQGLEQARAARWEKEQNYERQKTLYNGGGIASEKVFQAADREYREATAKVEQAEAYVAASQNDLESKLAELEEKTQQAQAYVDKAKADYQQAFAELQSKRQELVDIQVQLARQQSQEVRAPKDGFVFRLFANPGAEIIKQGEPLFTLVPDTTDRAVEILLSGNDVPLIALESHVRLQFEGWPAVQFAGWPSVAVGTFGGSVAVVDATDNGQGQFRILVVPDEADQEWPSERYLRQGVRANGWVLLNQVTLGFELWRKLNGFPPSVAGGEPKGAAPIKGGKK